MSDWSAISPDALPIVLAELIAARPGLVRVAVDGAPCTGPGDLAAALVEPLRALGRPAEHVRAETFWRDASLRLEYGREDLDSFPSWLDADALRREVLDASVTRSAILPSLRDPATNRSTREPARPVEATSVVVVSGELLLGRGLPFELTIHLSMSPAALERRLDPALRWTLPAYRDHAELSEGADIVIRMDDPRHPAMRSVS